MIIDELLNLWKTQFKLEQIDKIKINILKYKEFLQQENKKYNLTRLDDSKIIFDQYFYQSLINFNESMFFDNMNLLDIGSGSGIPGVVLKILFDEINLYIVEANKKKCIFLENLVKILNLKNVFIFNQRCEIFIKDKRNFFDFITCRAVSELRILLELAIPGLKIKGSAFFLKSENYLNELKNSKNIMEKLELKNPEINKIFYKNKTFVSIKYNKVINNSFVYPRNWNQIKNNN